MNRTIKIILITFAAVVIGGGAFTYGALTAPRPTTTPKPTPKAVVHKKPTKAQLIELLATERAAINSVLTAAYPKISTDYTIDPGQLYDEGQWYGTTLQYHGSDTPNRDTLRVLMQKKGSVWTLRTTPPQPLLSVKQFPDVPKDVLKAINQPVSLP